MSVLDLSKADNKDAKLTLKLRAKSGFTSHGDYQVSPNQWSEITAICEDGKQRQIMRSAPELLDAMEAVLAWTAWHNIGSQELEKARAAIAKARGDDTLARATEALNDETNEMVALSGQKLA